MTSHKEKVNKTEMSTFQCNKRSHQYVSDLISCKMCVKNFFWICAQPGSSSSVFCCGCCGLHCRISRWSGLCGRASLFSGCWPSGGSWVSRLHRVCVDKSVVYACLKLNWSGYPTASQHCSHNQSRHPKICYITFYFKASFPPVVQHHIQYESKT